MAKTVVCRALCPARPAPASVGVDHVGHRVLRDAPDAASHLHDSTMAPPLVRGLTETTFHRRFPQAVEIIKAGKPLHMQPPD